MNDYIFNEQEKFRFEQLVKARDNNNTIFNFWMTFFTVAIGALFVGYTQLITNNNEDKVLTFGVLILGYFVSFIWYLSCKGYHWWVRNWIYLIIHHEQKLSPNNRVYSCFYQMCNEGSIFKPFAYANISTAKLLWLFSFGVTVSWCILLIHKLDSMINLFCFIQNKILLILTYLMVSIILTMLLSLFSLLLKHSKMEYHENICPLKKCTKCKK